MPRQFTFAAVLVACSCLAVFAADPSAADYLDRGDAWIKKGDPDKAIEDYNEAIRLGPNSAFAYIGRGAAWQMKGDPDNAIKDFTEAIRLDPKHAGAYTNRGNAWDTKGELDNAIKDYTEAIRLDPRNVEAYTYRSIVRFEKGDLDNSIKDGTEAIRLDPKSSPAYNNLAWIFGTCANADFRNGPKAVEYAKQACELTAWKEAGYLDTLAAAYAEAGKFEEAIKWQEKAIELATKESDKEEMRNHLKLYEAGTPYRDSPKE